MVATKKSCIGWTVDRKGILVQCPKPVLRKRGVYHSRECQTWTRHRRDLGYRLGDRYVRYGAPGLPRTPRPCIGWTLDAAGIIVPCPELVAPIHVDKQYHSTQCYEWTWRRRELGYQLGDRYIKGRHIKQHPPKPCEAGWTIRDGVIAKCAEPFTRGRTDQKYHSSACLHRTRRWRDLGYHLGDAVRRTCAYRNCRKGEGGTRGTFDRIHRSLKSGDYFCDQRCRAGEQRARAADAIAAKLADARRLKNLEGLDLKTGFRVSLMAHGWFEGAKNLYEMRHAIYPDSADPFNAIKQLDRRFHAVIEDEKQRLAVLSDEQRRAEADSLRKRLTEELAKPKKL